MHCNIVDNFMLETKLKIDMISSYFVGSEGPDSWASSAGGQFFNIYFFSADNCQCCNTIHVVFVRLGTGFSPSEINQILSYKGIFIYHIVL